MYYSRLCSPRRLAAACLLALSGSALWLSSPGAAQNSVDGQGYSTPNVSMSEDGQDGGNNAASGGAAENRDADAGSYGASKNGDLQNPAVGVDTNGHADAVATRNGRTNRRRPVPLANPLVITSPTRGNGVVSPQTGDRIALPVPARAPRVYTLPADPNVLTLRRDAALLPLFGYDFFQPARQIILARRRALLPVRRIPSRSQRQTGTNRQRRLPTQGGQDNVDSQGSVLTNADQAPNDQSSNQTNADLAGAAALSRNRRTESEDSGYSQDAASGQNMTNSQDTASQDTANQDAPNQNAANQDAANQDAANQDEAVPDRAASRRSSRQSSETDAADSGGTSPDNGGMGSVDSSVDTGDANNFSDSTLDSADSTQQTRRRRTNTLNSSSGYDVFPGDTQAPGGDIQFPGDDTQGQSGSGGATNAVNGEIADPLATLYRNTLVSLPANYQLQPGDSLTVRYSALTIAPREVTAVVDAQGGISVGEIGRVSVAGRTAPQAEDFLRQRLSRLYRNVDVSISLRQLRTIQVTISGAAFAPGTYTVPATASAFNVLNAAGGPTAAGSLRDIRVLRGGRLAGIVDIYPLIGAASGNTRNRSGDLNLQAGDNIYIPARLSRIAIRGEVRQQAIYELTTTETLRDALNYAGGIKPSGVGQTIHIDTIDQGRGRALRDVSVTSRASVPPIPLYDGDTVEIASVRAILINRVTILGEVQQPGDYALTPGMRVLDLLQRARGTLPDTYLDRAQLISQNPDLTTRIRSISIAGALDGNETQNVRLANNDRLQIYSRQDVAYLGRRQVTVRGAVQRPGLYTQSDNMRVSDLLLGTGGPLPDAYLGRAVLLHQHGDGTFAYDYLSLHDILSGSDPSQDLLIQDNDVLAVYRVGEAHFTPDHTVKVLGNVVAPGLYARGENMRLSDLLKLSGGFKPGGGTRVTVAHARRPAQDTPDQVAPLTVAFSSQGGTELGTDLTLQDGDVVAVQGNGSIKDHPAVITVTGAVNRPGPINLSGTTRLSDAVREAGGLRPEAFPQGAEFTRMSDALATSGQLNLADVISHMSDMLNLSQYQRERAKASLALIQAAGSAASGSTAVIPGLGGQPAAPNANVGGLVDDLRTINPVSQGRILTPSQLQPNGGVAVRLAEALRHPGSSEDILLKDGDTLVVPETPTTVQVIGAVVNNSGVVYHPGEGIDYYVQHAGDYTPDAARDRIEVIHAGGGLIPAGKAGAIQPGDLIFVPTKVLAEKVGNSGGFSAFFQGLVGSAIALKVLSSVFGL